MKLYKITKGNEEDIGKVVVKGEYVDGSRYQRCWHHTKTWRCINGMNMLLLADELQPIELEQGAKFLWEGNAVTIDGHHSDTIVTLRSQFGWYRTVPKNSLEVIGEE